MAKEVKIIWFSEGGNKGYGISTENAEQEIADLLNDGWIIVAAGGGGATTSDQFSYDAVHGFIVLQRD